MTRIFVTPARKGLTVVNPFDQMHHLPAEGKEVVPDSYWYRLAADGDITIGHQAPVAHSAPAQQASVEHPRTKKTKEADK